MEMSTSIPQDQQSTALQTEPLFLYIPISRLVWMSILTVGLYEVYWMYKNWRYIGKRYGLDISPFWRGSFGIFFVGELLVRIHNDIEANAVEIPRFHASSLAIGWVVLVFLPMIIDRYTVALSGHDISSFLGYIPTFLCFVPVQMYINSVTRKRSGDIPYYGWSVGHILCLVFGLVITALNFGGERIIRALFH